MRTRAAHRVGHTVGADRADQVGLIVQARRASTLGRTGRPGQRGRGHRRAFTLFELGVVTTVGVPVAALLLPMFGGARREAQKLQDQDQLRAISAGLSIFANANAGSFPLPSELDVYNWTVTDGAYGVPSRDKDNSSHIWSVMVFQQLISTKQCISPVEPNSSIVQNRFYQFDDPREVPSLTRALALWDPRFSAYPGSSTGAFNSSISFQGNFSYYHLIPHGDRRSRWNESIASDDVVLGNRGPNYRAFGSGAGLRWELEPGSNGTSSIILGSYGSSRGWAGNLAFGDGRVEFETRPDPEELTYTFANNGSPFTRPDNVFEVELTRGTGLGGHLPKWTNSSGDFSLFNQRDRWIWGALRVQASGSSLSITLPVGGI